MSAIAEHAIPHRHRVPSPLRRLTVALASVAQLAEVATSVGDYAEATRLLDEARSLLRTAPTLRSLR